MTDTSCEDVRGAFLEEHLHNKVDACDAYVLTVYPFGRDDEQPDDYETEDWENDSLQTELEAFTRDVYHDQLF